MHKYLRAIGFSKCNSRVEVENLLLFAEKNAGRARSIKISDTESYRQSYMALGNKIGISSCGITDENNNYYREFYFPYVKSEQVSTQVECEIQRHSDTEAYSGMCEEYKLGVSLIFYLQNGIEYLENKSDKQKSDKVNSVMLSGLSVCGEIILPVKKTVQQAEKLRIDSMKRSILYEEARQGSETAIETLTMEDMDIFSKINERIVKEDIYSIVDTSFLPYGVECDHYSIVGEIIEIVTDVNEITGEEVYIFTLECNTLMFQLCINKEDLLGEPRIGRRFKGVIWMQGTAVFSEGE